MISGKDRQNKYFLTSSTRITDFGNDDFEVTSLRREDWGHGDYIAARVTGQPNALYKIEISSGRMVEVMSGDLIIGALGNRSATLEGVGSWEAIGADGWLHALTSAGLLGKATSTSFLLPSFMTLQYDGHVTRNGQKQTMRSFIQPTATKAFDKPVILLVGTSMSAGKTTAGRVIVHELTNAGLRIVGAKLTGAARYRDMLSFLDSGAEAILDFVDAGLPSTVVPAQRFDEAMSYLLSRIAAIEPDILVAEAGASPMEPYNGAAAIEALDKRVVFVMLCASDPYSVVGVQSAFGLRPDVITGPATNTTAGVNLIRKLTGLPALNLLDPASQLALRAMLREALPEPAATKLK